MSDYIETQGKTQRARAQNNEPRPSAIELWFRQDVFKNWWNALISLVLLAVVFTLLYRLLRFIFRNADWLRVIENLKLLAVYNYPANLLWRPFVALMLLVFVAGLAAGCSKLELGRQVFYAFSAFIAVLTLIALLFFPGVRWFWCAVLLSALFSLALSRIFKSKIRRNLPLIMVSAWLLAISLLLGAGSEGSLRFAHPKDWGGVLVSLLLPITAAIFAFPLGLAFALGKHSKLPVFRLVSISVSSLVKAVPLIVWLFAFHTLLAPLFTGMKVEPLYRAQLALILFAAVYMADIIEGFLLKWPKEQAFAARALGLKPWSIQRSLLLPYLFGQLGNQWLALLSKTFKDTTLVIAVGILDVFALWAGVQNQLNPQTIIVDVTHEMFLVLLFFYGSVSYALNLFVSKQDKMLSDLQS